MTNTRCCPLCGNPRPRAVLAGKRSSGSGLYGTGRGPTVPEELGRSMAAAGEGKRLTAASEASTKHGCPGRFWTEGRGEETGRRPV